ncbi:MAG: hypothetical protein EOM46_03245 [Gammaproteobacteria bacterium]|nr:hypothetical protein [Gammaproteobacteria bacterium]
MEKNIQAIRDDFGRIASLWMICKKVAGDEESLKFFIKRNVSKGYYVCLMSMLFETAITLARLFDKDPKRDSIHGLLEKLNAAPHDTHKHEKIIEKYNKITELKSFKDIEIFHHKYFMHNSKDAIQINNELHEILDLCQSTYSLLLEIELSYGIEFKIDNEYLSYWEIEADKFWP